MPAPNSSAAADRRFSIVDPMRVLVTRPEPDAKRTADRLRTLGHDPVIAPLLVIASHAPPADLPDPAALVLTSRNAVTALSRWPQASHWRDRPVFVTGRGTGEAACSAGFTDVRSADGDANDLAALVMSGTAPDVGPILYPAARDRSDTFVAPLRAAGYDIRVVEAYRADVVPAFDAGVREALRSGRIDVVLLYSRRTAEAYRRAAERAGLESAVRRIRICALSHRVAEPLANFVDPVDVARHPDEAALLALL
jgi:uroporphyrinogen-III synthase